MSHYLVQIILFSMFKCIACSYIVLHIYIFFHIRPFQIDFLFFSLTCSFCEIFHLVIVFTFVSVNVMQKVYSVTLDGP